MALIGFAFFVPIFTLTVFAILFLAFPALRLKAAVRGNAAAANESISYE